MRAKRVLHLRNLPFALQTVEEVEAAVLHAFRNGVARSPKVRSVILQRRLSGRYNGSAWVDLVDEREIDATIRSIRASGIKIGGRNIIAKIALRSDDDSNEAELSDDLGHATAVFAANSVPTLYEIREVLLRNDSHRILRRAMLPGLTLPEWQEQCNEEHDTNRKERWIPMGRFAETIVRVDRVQKVVQGGVTTRFRALVVVGNLLGAGGFAFGKAATPADAVARASKAAKRDLHFFERFLETALAHDVSGSHNNCTVEVFATPPGSGVKGGKLGRAILMQLGFSSFTIKAYGRRTPASYVYAIFNALNSLLSVEQLARSRGRRLLQVEHALMVPRRVTHISPKFKLRFNMDGLKEHVAESTTIDFASAPPSRWP